MLALIDCNNFFVSCERVFQPQLRFRPTLVLSSNDGCVIARSQEVKDLGIPMGIPLFKIKDMVKKYSIVLRSTNFNLYRDMSRRVMNVLRQYTDQIEVYSIDEAFIQIPKNVPPFKYCNAIREQVLLQTGIPVSIGIASTKTLAKLANKKAKERQTSSIFIFDNIQKQKRILKETSVGEIWGIGKEFVIRLTEKGIKDAYQLTYMPDTILKKIFGMGTLKCAYELRGIHTYEFKTISNPKKSIISSRSFEKRITTKNILWKTIAHHIDEVSRELRHSHQITNCLHIGIYTNRFGLQKYNSRTKQCILPHATNDTTILLSTAQILFDSLYEKNIEYSKSGVRVSELYPDTYAHSKTLFDSDIPSPRSSLDFIIDTIEKKHGSRSIVRGSLLDSKFSSKSWQSKSSMKSSEYTTSWSGLLSISKRVY